MLDLVLDWMAQRTMLEAFEAVFVVLSMIGQHFNSEQNKVGFYYWGAGNVIAIGVFVVSGRWLTAALYCYFLWKCITGVIRWSAIAKASPAQAGTGLDASRSAQVA